MVFGLLSYVQVNAYGSEMLTIMQRAKAYIVGVVIWASIFLFGVLRAFADSYTVNVVTYTQSDSFVGIDTAGDFVVNLTNSLLLYPGQTCGGVAGASTCFATYYAGQSNPVVSTALPSLHWDNGARCMVGALSGVCNGEYALLGGFLNDVRGVWASAAGSLTEVVANGSFDGGYINALGDAVFMDGTHDTLVSVMDSHVVPELGLRPLIADEQPVPEPASVWLVGLGLLASAMLLVRRRAYCRAEARKKRG